MVFINVFFVSNRIISYRALHALFWLKNANKMIYFNEYKRGFEFFKISRRYQNIFSIHRVV